MRPLEYLKTHTEWAAEDPNQPNRFFFRFMNRNFVSVVHTDAEANNLLNGLMNTHMKDNKPETIK